MWAQDVFMVDSSHKFHIPKREFKPSLSVENLSIRVQNVYYQHIAKRSQGIIEYVQYTIKKRSQH